ncbi:preprotein translocase subunit YajC [Arsenicicoccus piscis]|uniref:Preprotein translocase subunit YajC n=2 Tax=Arsenicicoccus piscis TaxID=673954 RepID=A0ABQ6HQT4_9MICO|nr:preprotein translocase subunit YajC [Arsenicicoccus piscis]GMA19834.1 hypothetical protein GCM10025862_18550 [Arsenicicoccus piscis]
MHFGPLDCKGPHLMFVSGLLPMADQGSASWLSLVMFALPLLLVFYFLMAGRARQKAATARSRAVAVGDKVVTTSGLYGTVVALSDSIASLETAPGVVMEFDRRAILGAIDDKPVTER